MLHWPLLLPPPAVSTPTSPSRSHGSSSSHHRAVPCRRVAVAVTPSLAVALHPPSPSIRHCIVHHSRSIAAAIAPTLAVEEPLRRPLPSRSRCTFHCLRRRGAIAPSLAIKEPSRRLLPLPSRRHCAVPRHRGAVAPSLAISH